MFGDDGGESGLDERSSQRAAVRNVGAWILGRNMFGPVRGPWPDDELEGLVGRGPAVPRPDLRPDAPSARAAPHGGRHGLSLRHRRHPRRARARAKAAAGGKDVRLGGGAATIRQYLQARLIDELHLAIAPVLLGRGESLLAGIDLRALGYECVKHIPGERAAAHVIIRKRRT